MDLSLSYLSIMRIPQDLLYILIVDVVSKPYS